VSHSTLPRPRPGLKKELKSHGITHDQVATAANVGRTLVVHVLAGRAKSANVVATAKRLIAERQAQPENGGSAA